MPFSGIRSTVSSEETARAGGHDPVIRVEPVKANDGTYPAGLILSRQADGKLVPMQVVASVDIGTGDGTNKTFTATLANFPVMPGSVAVTAENLAEAFSDNGCGVLKSAAGGTGTVNYKTGAISVTFFGAPAATKKVQAAYQTPPVAVLDASVDTAASGSATVIRHGSVKRGVLKVGKTAPAVPTAAQLAQLADAGVYPV